MCKIGLLQTHTVFLFSRITPSGVRTEYVRIEKSLSGKAFFALKISQKIFLFYCILRIMMIFQKCQLETFHTFGFEVLAEFSQNGKILARSQIFHFVSNCVILSSNG